MLRYPLSDAERRLIAAVEALGSRAIMWRLARHAGIRTEEATVVYRRLQSMGYLPARVIPMRPIKIGESRP